VAVAALLPVSTVSRRPRTSALLATVAAAVSSTAVTAALPARAPMMMATPDEPCSEGSIAINEQSSPKQ
jgi:hypothetical protein